MYILLVTNLTTVNKFLPKEMGRLEELSNLECTGALKLEI
jgi:hypothetical protein